MSHLLILNYSMDENNPALAHQIEVVRRLSGSFNRITVVTGFRGEGFLPQNVEVVSTNWMQGHHVRNISSFLRITWQIFQKSRPDVIFSHMTHIQSALLLPLSRFRGTPHFLWYAHASSSLALRWDYLLVNKILTSTRGSFPFAGKKVTYIGQAVDTDLFFADVRRNVPSKFVHYGRFDKSKRIETIIEVADLARASHRNITLTICGNPSDLEARRDANRIISKNKENIEIGWLSFVEAKTRRFIPEWLSDFDVLLHAFQGSLDKVLVESVIAGLTVVTINSEFISEFGSWGKYSDEQEITLKAELEAMMTLEPSARNEFNLNRQSRALKYHSESKWVQSVCEILMAAL